MKRAIRCGLLILSLVCAAGSDAGMHDKRAGERDTVDVGTYQVRMPSGGEWTVDVDPEAGSARFNRVLKHPSEAGKTASATSIQVVRKGTETEKWHVPEAKVAEDYLVKEEERAREELGRRTGHEVKLLGRGTAKVGRKKLYSMSYQAVKPDVSVDAAFYLYFPEDYRRHHTFYVFFVSDAYTKGLHTPDLAVVNAVISSLKIKSNVYPQAALQSELLRAIDDNKLSKARSLLEQGADVNGKNSDGWSPLVVAASKGYVDIVRLLLDKGALVNAKTPQGQTPLMFAAHWGHVEIVKILIEHGEQVDAAMVDGWTPLIDAAQMDKAEVVKLLIDNGADVKKRSSTGWTALMAASFNNRSDLVKLILQKGADVNTRDETGKTALGVAKAKGYSEIIRVLTEAGGIE
jgi:ankyrin repeat protein